MFSHDQADIDPRNPANWREPVERFEVRGHNDRWIADFNDEDFAKAFVFNTELYLGGELNVLRIDEEYGDHECVLFAEFDDEIQRYVEA